MAGVRLLQAWLTTVDAGPAAEAGRLGPAPASAGPAFAFPAPFFAFWRSFFFLFAIVLLALRRLSSSSSRSSASATSSAFRAFSSSCVLREMHRTGFFFRDAHVVS